MIWTFIGFSAGFVLTLTALGVQLHAYWRNWREWRKRQDEERPAPDCLFREQS